jgi:hypothetical protein
MHGFIEDEKNKFSTLMIEIKKGTEVPVLYYSKNYFLLLLIPVGLPTRAIAHLNPNQSVC